MMVAKGVKEMSASSVGRGASSASALSTVSSFGRFIKPSVPSFVSL